VFGYGQELPENQLPSNLDVMKQMVLLKQQVIILENVLKLILK